MPDTIISMKNINKDFTGVSVLKHVDFNIYDGNIMALIGENGAGKSTLMKILTGVYTKTSGEVLWNNNPVHFSTITDSQKQGIAIIHQELNLIQNLSIGENIFLGREPVNSIGKINWKKLYEEAKVWLDTLGLKEDPRTLIKNISVGKQQLVEIAKALSLNARVIIMDEPTGALTVAETEKLFGVIRELKAKGKSIVYISHRLKEIFELCDHVTVLRDGELIGESPIESLDEDKIIEMMVGRKLSEQYPSILSKPGKTVLEVKELCNQFVHKISFALREGEIVGVAGLMGAGRTELARTLFGIYAKESGEILLSGNKIRLKNPADAIKHGIAYVSEDRKANGIVLGLNVRENITLAALKAYSSKVGAVYKSQEEETTDKYIKSMSIKTSGSKQLVRYLSGGNQQKVSIAKSLETKPKVLILDEPTRGVDVGAKKEIYDLINLFKQQGMCILMISSEIPEIIGMSDRIMVMHEGTLTGTLDRSEVTQESIMSLAVGKDVD